MYFYHLWGVRFHIVGTWRDVLLLLLERDIALILSNICCQVQNSGRGARSLSQALMYEPEVYFMDLSWLLSEIMNPLPLAELWNATSNEVIWKSFGTYVGEDKNSESACSENVFREGYDDYNEPGMACEMYLVCCFCKGYELNEGPPLKYFEGATRGREKICCTRGCRGEKCSTRWGG